MVGDTAFAHGGLLASHVEYGLERLNADVAAWMRGDARADGGAAPPPFLAMGDSTSVMWNRAYGKVRQEGRVRRGEGWGGGVAAMGWERVGGPAPRARADTAHHPHPFSQERYASPYERFSACAALTAALEAAGAARLVVGHTPQAGGCNCECGGLVWRVDVGMSRGVLNAIPQAREGKGVGGFGAGWRGGGRAGGRAGRRAGRACLPPTHNCAPPHTLPLHQPFRCWKFVGTRCGC